MKSLKIPRVLMWDQHFFTITHFYIFALAWNVWLLFMIDSKLSDLLTLSSP